MSQPTRIVVFAKAPLPGLAKTRLSPALGADGAARLAARLLQHAVQEALTSGVGPVELCASPSPESPAWQGAVWPAQLQLSDQGSGDLGERLARAARRTVNAGLPVLLMGTDCPSLTADRLRAACNALVSTDAVMTPATDGGYVLLGLKRFDASLFADIEWSTDRVASATRQRLEALGWRLTEQAPLPDIDVPADLRLLPAGWVGSRV